MKSLIIYGSQYGTAKAYAEKLAEMTGILAVSYETVKDLTRYEQIIYFGGLYAGGVKGLKRTVKKLKNSRVRLMIITVGLADVSRKENMDHIKKFVEKQVEEQFLENAVLFHLRGGIDYRKVYAF